MTAFNLVSRIAFVKRTRDNIRRYRFLLSKDLIKKAGTETPLPISLCSTNQDSLIDQSKKVVKTVLRIRNVYEKSNIRMVRYLIKKLAQILSLKKGNLACHS